VRSLQYLPLPDLHDRLAPMLDDPVRAVRVEAARMLSAVPRRAFSQKDADAFDAALAEHLEGQEAVNDQPAAHLNLGVIYTNLGELELAEKAYRQALAMNPRFVPARINLAMLHDQQGNKAEAESQFRKAIEFEPDLAEAHYSLGLLLAEDDSRLDAASEFLGRAARLAPENARIHYNYGLALQRLGRADPAEQALKTAVRLAPGSTDYLHALAILYTQQMRWGEAKAVAAELQRLEPGNRNWLLLQRHIEAQSARAADPAAD